MLLACIKNLRTLPCLQCLITKAEIPALGIELDMQKRQSVEGIRMDNDTWKHWVKHVWKAIYVKGKPIVSKHVNNLLSNESLVSEQ